MLSRTQKEKIVEDLKDKIAKQKAVIFIDFTGLKVKDFSHLRKKLKEVEGEIKVAKKTLMGIAFKEAKIEVKKLPGEVALVFGYKDEILPAKIVYQFSQENPNLKILGGFLENSFKEAKDIIALAQLPSREELLLRLVNSLSAPLSNLVNLLSQNLRNFIYLLSQINPVRKTEFQTG